MTLDKRILWCYNNFNLINQTVDAEIKADKPSQRALLLRKGKKHLSNGPLRVQSNAAT